MTNAIDRYPLRTIAWVLLAALIALVASIARADVTASVDRNRIGTDETLTLTLRSDSASMFAHAPNLSPLHHDFDVLGMSTSTEQRIINNSSSASTRWIIRLAPHHAGTLTIPPITIGGSKTRAITIQAVPSSQAPTAGDDVFVKAVVSSKVVYHTAQLLLTVRIYHRGGLAQGSSLQQPDINDTLVQQVNRSDYRKFVDGIGYQVIEQTYAVFPSKAGTLTIAPFTLHAEITSPASASRFNPFGTTRTMIRRSEPISIEVKPSPTSYQGNDWLPARSLTLKQSFSHDPGSIHVGQSITRKITISAHGLLASQLPPLFVDPIDGLKVYPDQPQVHNIKSARGITGSRKESIALVPTKPGKYTLPVVKVHWWDLKADRERVATLPAMTLTVLPAPGSDTASATLAPPASPTSPVSNSIPAVAPVGLWPWISAVVVLAGAWLATLWWYWRQRRHWSEPVVAATPAPADHREEAAWCDLQAACHANDLSRAQPALYRWIRLLRGRTDICCMNDLRKLGANPVLIETLARLDAALSAEHHEWDGRVLIEAAAVERQGAVDTAAATSTGLPGLYDY